MKTLKERGYEYPNYLGYNREQYRLRAAFMLENNELLPEKATPTTLETLLTLYREEFGLDVIYIPRLKERRNALGATASIVGSGPQIYLDESLLDENNSTLRKLHLTTLAHELGHAFLHYEEIHMRSAALTDLASSLMIKEACSNDYWLEYLKKRDGKKRNLSKSEFIEYQANQIMVGLLMPFNTLYNQAAQTIKFKLDCLHKENGWSRGFSIRARLPEIFNYVVTQMSECYQVSKQMASFELYRILNDDELNLIFGGITPADPIEKRLTARNMRYTG